MVDKPIKIAYKFLKRLSLQPGIVILGGYPYTSRLSDGYFQRIDSINNQFSNVLQIHLDRKNLPGNKSWADIPAKDVLTISIRHNWAARVIALLSIITANRLYIHSVYPLKYFAWLLWLPKVKTLIDFHGLVPEEQQMKQADQKDSIYERLEKKAFHKADHHVFVSKTMAQYLHNKYNHYAKKAQTILPIVPELSTSLTPKPPFDGKPIVVYAGGLQLWQQIPKMIDAIKKTASCFQFKIFTPEINKFNNLLKEQNISEIEIEITSKSHKELLDAYQGCHFGFLLRKDDPINWAACPTKLIEYIAFGIIPILDSPEIGDFPSLGLKFIRLEDFIQQNMPDQNTLAEMVEINTSIYQTLIEQYRLGIEQIRDWFFR